MPLRTGTILVRSVVDMLTACNAVPYSPNLRALAMAATMLPPTNESGGSTEFSDSGGLLSSTSTLDHDSSYTSTAESNNSSPQFCLAVHQSVADILNPEPKSYKQVLSSPDKDAWTNAINSELNSIINDKEAATFIFRKHLPRAANLLPSRFALKYLSLIHI